MQDFWELLIGDTFRGLTFMYVFSMVATMGYRRILQRTYMKSKYAYGRNNGN